MQTETTTQPFHEWEPARRQRLKIASLGVVIDDIDTEDEWGSKLYRVLKCYQSSLLRQYQKQPTSSAEREQMKESIQALDECFHALMEEPEMAGWFYGIDTDDNLGYGIANLLITVRNELLLAIAIRY